MNCAVHLDQPAVAACCTCGGGVCPACRNKMFGRNYCDVCAALLERQMLERRDASPTVIREVIVERPRYSPAVAGALAVFLPGAGHLYAGRAARGVGWFIVTVLTLPTFWLALFVWPFQVADAVDSARSENNKRRDRLTDRR